MADVLFGGLEQVGHVLLGEPDGLALQPDINLHLAVFGLIDEELALGREIGLIGRIHASRISVTLLAIVVSSSRAAALSDQPYGFPVRGHIEMPPEGNRKTKR